jgi:hypothetical protein
MPKVGKKTARSTLNVDVVVGASRPKAAGVGGKVRKPGQKNPATRTIGTRKNPLLVASLVEMGSNLASLREESQGIVSGDPPSSSVTVTPVVSDSRVIPSFEIGNTSESGLLSRLAPIRDEFLISSGSDASTYNRIARDRVPQDTTVRPSELYGSTHMLNAEVVSRSRQFPSEGTSVQGDIHSG